MVMDRALIYVLSLAVQLVIKVRLRCFVSKRENAKDHYLGDVSIAEAVV